MRSPRLWAVCLTLAGAMGGGMAIYHFVLPQHMGWRQALAGTGYLPEVIRLLVQGSDEQAIAEYLGTIATGRMGLPSRPERDLEAARTVIGWRQSLMGAEPR